MSRPTPARARASSTYTSALSRYAAKLSRRRLSHISLANILAGHTCSPIGLSDFEAYLALKEHSLENLHFALWYQSYRKRYLALASSLPQARPQQHSKSDSFHFPISTPARTAQRISETRRQSEASSSLSSSPTDSTFSVDYGSSSRRGSAVPPPSRTSPHPSQLPALPYTSTFNSFTDDAAPHKTSPMRSLQVECARATATFLTPNSPEELMLDAEVRDALLRELTWSIHPDAFLSVYESVVEALETFSLPRFLEHASANINSPKQIFWYAVGIFDMLLAIALAVSLIILLPRGMSEASRRAWRLIAVPLFSLGSMQAYSAWRGFCSEVWGRGNTQIRVWELEEAEPGAASCSSSPWLALSTRSPPVTPGEERTIVLSNVYEDEREGRASCQCSLRSSTSTTPKAQTFTPDAYDDTAATPGPDSPGMIGRTACGSRCDKQRKASHIRIDTYTSPVDASSSQCGSGECETTPAPLFDHWGWETPARGGSAGTAKGWTHGVKLSREAARASARAEFRRPPVFGPERPVLDPHIRAVHRAVMRDMLVAGFVCTSVFTVVILAVPGARRS